MRRFPISYAKEFSFFRELSSPEKIQDFLDTLPVNFERRGCTARSPREALRRKEAHCMEGALIAAAALWYHGKPPLLLDLKTARDDESHVVALFKKDNRWGAISKTNHAVLRYRDAVFASPRELAMSYFNEYFLDSGKKTLRSFSAPFSLLRYGDRWLVAEGDLWNIVEALDRSKHLKIITGRASLRRADPIEIRAGKLLEWRRGHTTQS
jgi:hypothetical protein